MSKMQPMASKENIRGLCGSSTFRKFYWIIEFRSLT